MTIASNGSPTPSADAATAAALADCRRRIDEYDRQLVALLNARARVVEEVGQLKQGKNIAVFIPEREEGVFENVRAANEGPLANDALKPIYREILSAMRSLEDVLTVAFLGPVYTFTHEAASRRFGASARYLPMPSVADVFTAVERGQADYGVVAIENSIQGTVVATLDAFVHSDLKICAEILLPIGQHLLGAGPIDAVRRIYSHPMALGQCRVWLAAHAPQAERVEVSSTARAAELAHEEPAAAAIGSRLLADHYGLNVLAEHVQDRSDNATRFYVLGRQVGQPSGNDRTAVMLSIRDRVGALHDITGCFSRHSLSMSRIDYRPSQRKSWDYVFFVEVSGHPADPNVAAALEELREYCLSVRLLGAWRKGELASVSA